MEGAAVASQLNHLACRRDAAPGDALSDAGPRHPYPADSPVARERGCQAKRTVASPPRRKAPGLNPSLEKDKSCLSAVGLKCDRISKWSRFQIFCKNSVHDKQKRPNFFAHDHI